MPDLKLLIIEDGDDQKSLIDKSNANFSNLIAFGGGPYGKIGPVGPEGDQGNTGPVGSYGDLGQRGSIWKVSSENPGTTGYLDGDFWLNMGPGLGVPIYQFNNSTWGSYGFNLVSQDLFRVYSPLPTSAGDSSYSGYHLSSINPDRYTLVISDNSLVGATASTNPQYSKFVISTNGATSGRPILEFAKADNLSNSSLYTKNPRFIWTNTSANYDLSLLVTDSFLIDVSSGELGLKITGNSGSGLVYKSRGLSLNLSGTQGLYLNTTGGRIIFDMGATGYAVFSNRNINYLSDTFTLPVKFEFNSESTDSNPPLNLTSNKSYLSGLRHKTNVTPSRNSNLFRVYNTSDLLVNLFSNGELYYNKRVTSIQAPQTPTTTSTGSAYTGGAGGAGSTVTVNWVSVVPTAISQESTSGNRINVSNGIDYEVSLASVSAQRGIYLWTPATGGSSQNDNGGWLQYLNPLESITLRIRATGNNNFRFLGLGTGTAFTTAPVDTINSYQAIDLTNSSTVGASNAELTLINMTNSVSDSRSSYSRWFKVYYSAWGGNLDCARCGYLYSQIIISSFINTGNIVLSTYSLSQTAPFSTSLVSGSGLTPLSSATIATPYFNSGTSLSSSVTFASTPTTVTATLTRYPSGTVNNGTITGSGTSRTITWTGIDLSTSSAYVVRVSGT